MKNVLIFCLGMLSLIQTGMAEVRIEDVRATPVSPWGRIVVDYTVAGTLPTNVTDYVAVVTASNRMTGAVYVGGRTEGETSLALGSHRVWWDTRIAGLREAAETVDVNVSYMHGDMESMEYCVIDLSNGSGAKSYPVLYFPNMPVEGWSDECKTTKLVLRRTPAGTFIMGSDQANESRRVTLTKPFYMGVFEVTQRQWELVMGSCPGSSPSSSSGRGDAYPAYSVTYYEIRGSSSGARWPASAAVDASSFLGRLRAKTGLEFDLPTEAQWEVSCRAGAVGLYGDRDSTAANTNLLLRFASPKVLKKVGDGRLPNAWGLYDMLGNCGEVTLDALDAATRIDGVDPTGPDSLTTKRVVRGLKGGDEDENVYAKYLGIQAGYRTGLAYDGTGSWTTYRFSAMRWTVELDD